jgi:hypothetical protein
MTGLRRTLPWLLILGLLSCQTHRQAAWRKTVRRDAAIAIADSYLHHTWHPSQANVKHGPDSNGTQVDTPDISYVAGIPGWWKPGAPAKGVPYQWGGFSTPAQFDEGIKAGLAAGDVYTQAKRTALDAAVSTQAVGIDCSGFISRCWKLERSFSTRELPGLCEEIPWDDLKPGDILNTHNSHVMLFAGWADDAKSKLTAYETGCPPTWKVMRHDIDRQWLEGLGFQAWRYRGMGD